MKLSQVIKHFRKSADNKKIICFKMVYGYMFIIVDSNVHLEVYRNHEPAGVMQAMMLHKDTILYTAYKNGVL